MSDPLRVRVRLLEAWNDVDLVLPASTPIGDVKRQVLDAAHVTADPAGFLVKFRGAELPDERRTLGGAGVPDGAALIVLRRHRVPVR